VAFFPDLMTNTQFAPIHKKTIDKFGKEWTKPGNLVGNGAFMLKDWQVNSKVVVEKNPKYWDAAAVVLNKVTFLPVEDGNADIKLFQSGENEMVYQLPPGTYESLKKSNPQDIKNGPMLGLRFYVLYNKDPVMKDVRVRKALSMVIDRDILANKITADGQVPAYGIVVKGINGADVTSYEWATWPMAKKVEEAKKLLAEAGLKPGSKIKFTYNTSEYHKKMAIFAASEWKTKLGLETEMDNLEFKVLIKKRHDGDYQIARHGWVADFNDVSTFLTLIQCDSDSNDSKNCNRKGEELILQGNNSLDPVKRKALLTQAAKLIMDDYPIIPLVQYTLPRLVKSYVGGYFESNPMDHFRSKDFYIIKH
jgi:oligopeptide transport system substrate-binding protein